MLACLCHHLVAVDPNEGLDDTLANRSEGLNNTTAKRVLEEEEEEGGFVLEPVERAGFEKRVKKKRRLVVDTDKEFTGQQIKSQFDDYKDLLQPKCFPPPTKKAMMWKEMAGCDQLYSNPTFPLGLVLNELITQNYSVDVPGEPAPENVIELDKITDASREADVTPSETVLHEERDADATNTTLQDVSKVVEPAVPEGSVADEAGPGPEVPLGEVQEPVDPGMDGLGGGMDGLGGGMDGGMDGLGGGMDGLGVMDGLDGIDGPGGIDGPVGEQLEDASTVISKEASDALDIDELQSTEEQQSNELSEEFEQRRWTKRTQQVLKLLQKNLSTAGEVYFSTLTLKCNRKQAASRFYTCLLLAKEGMITATQPEPYADIVLRKGPKYVE